MSKQLIIAGGACLFCSGVWAAGELEETTVNPPDAARPGVYWYFMDGNMNGKEMVADLESMKAAGVGLSRNNPCSTSSPARWGSRGRSAMPPFMLDVTESLKPVSNKLQVLATSTSQGKPKKVDVMLRTASMELAR